jgi:uncharacterized protein (UPF0262 family)
MFFKLEGSPGGPYHLTLGLEENRLVLDVRLENGSDHAKVLMSLTPLRKTVKDYFLVCDNYYKAIRTAPPHQIEGAGHGAAHPCTTKAPRNCRRGWRARWKPTSTPRGGCSR